MGLEARTEMGFEGSSEAVADRFLQILNDFLASHNLNDGEDPLRLSPEMYKDLLIKVIEDDFIKTGRKIGKLQTVLLCLGLAVVKLQEVGKAQESFYYLTCEMQIESIAEAVAESPEVLREYLSLKL